MNRGQSGTTLLEVVVATALLATLLVALSSSLTTTRRVSEDAVASLDLVEQLRAVARRLSDELRSSTRLGEDVNDSGVLDPGEDLNGNGLLERDWHVTPNALTLNRVQPDGTCSPPITWRLNGTVLERLSVAPDGSPVTGVVARSVRAFDVGDDGSTVTVRIRLQRQRLPREAEERERTIVVVPRS